ncbi:hypothetical protein GOBAR_AA37021 [Gossypium barbadense]|uniref:Uncharacterized protein n=1 Tax=Gossypium barbadense TaxID=3634 RepID=A0A2P5VXX5_GOSBA|nr:hypothetical protein GOBAR_AA37021 [Gossypium barbadense]
MELVEDDDMEIMITLDCSPENVKLVELFMELVDVEPVQNVTPLNQQYEVEDPYTKVPKASVDSGFNHQGEDFSDLDIDEVPDDIDKEGTYDDDIVYAPLLENPAQSIVIRNDPSIYMLSVDLAAAHAFELLKYPDIIPSHRLVSDSKS